MLKEQTQAFADALAALIVTAVTAALKKSGGKAAPPAEEEEAPAPAATGRKRKGKAKVTQDQVREALMALNTAKGKGAVVEVLSRFGATKIGDLEEANYSECKAAADADAADEEEEEGEDDLFG